MVKVYGRSIAALLRGQDLDKTAAAALMEGLMTGALGEVRAAALLTALAAKGEAAGEIAAMAAVMREHATPVLGASEAVDTCGTGGSGLDTANTSTMSAFVLAAAGARVVKHGNRSASGRCGSMDLLERLGGRIDLGPEEAARVLRQVGITVLFAPIYHPAMRHVVPVRKALGFRTVFNFLGPLCNPAAVRRQVVGVCEPERAATMAGALAALGTERALVVHGSDGLDELTLCAPSRIWVVRNGAVSEQLFDPEELGLPPVSLSEIAGGEAERNAVLFESVLRGDECGPHAWHLQLNAAAGLLVAGLCEDLASGYQMASEILASGAAWCHFEAWREASQAVEVGP